MINKFLVLTILVFTAFACLPDKQKKSLGKMQDGEEVFFHQNVNGTWELHVGNEWQQPQPCRIELFTAGERIELTEGYKSVEIKGGVATAIGEITSGKAKFFFTDKWNILNGILALDRKVKVEGDDTGGFMSSVSLLGNMTSREEADFFVPGMIYGDPANLTRSAIGGIETEYYIRIREDRLPAPMFGIKSHDGGSVTILHTNPQGNTTQADAADFKIETMVDSRFRFAALGVDWYSGQMQIGCWYPGSEGETTYVGNTFPGGQLKQWRLRYHPVSDGLEQQYSLKFRLSATEKTFPDYYTTVWRWVWDELQPKLVQQPIEQIKTALLDMLGERVITKNGRTGIPNCVTGAEYEPYEYDKKATLGFTGKNIEASYFLLRDAQEREGTNIGEKHRKLACDIIATFIKIPMSPPKAEGFNFDTEELVLSLPWTHRLYMRSFTDDIKSLLYAVKFEREYGREHPEWIEWARSFADWLLTQQQPEGGFPRAWDVTGKVIDASPKSSYNPIPMFLLLTELTDDGKYKEAAIRAGEFVWNDGQYRGLFVGGTIDNPDVVDKESGTLSCEAYLELYKATGDKKWVDRAASAANFAETWIFLWEVPIPDDDTEPTIAMKPGMTTVGGQLISTGHSLADNYMAFDADEYAHLWCYTGDQHYRDVARLLLHNTKTWIQMPGRNYGMRGDGWQQESWSMVHRGHSWHRLWLPWVSTSQLNGIYGVQDMGEEVMKELEWK